MSLRMNGSSVEVETVKDITSPEAALEVMGMMDEHNLKKSMLVVGTGYTAVIASVTRDTVIDYDGMKSLNQKFTRSER